MKIQRYVIITRHPLVFYRFEKYIHVYIYSLAKVEKKDPPNS